MAVQRDDRSRRNVALRELRARAREKTVAQSEAESSDAGAPLLSGYSRVLLVVGLILLAIHFLGREGGPPPSTRSEMGSSEQPADATPSIPDPGAQSRDDETSIPSPAANPARPRVTTAIAERPPQALGTTELILEPGDNGNFFVNGTINQQPVVFMVDTGASWIAVPERLKTALRLNRGGYVQVSTANGVIGNYQTQIDTMTVGPLKFSNVQGALNPYAPNDTVLLGMSALKNIELVQQNGRMILRQQNQSEEIVEAQHVEPTRTREAPLRRSLSECMGPDRRIDQATLNCLEGR